MSLHQIIVLSEVLTTLAYAAVAFVYAMAYYRDAKPFNDLRAPLLYAALGLHFIFIGAWSMEMRRCLVTNVFEVMTLLAFIITFIYVVLERVTKTSSSGFFILPIVFVLQLVSALFLSLDGGAVNSIFLSVPVNVHVTTALFGYAALAMAGTYGAMYLLLFRSIKSNSFGTVFERLPSLAHLEQMSLVSVRFGLAFLAVTILVGIVWLPADVKDFSYSDPKFLVTVCLWLVYFGGLLARRFARWEGKRLMEISMYGFLAALFSLTIINFFFSGFHKFL
ncbi:MAG TPA: cytochrome c biogenesis protein CcsA [Candidatus Kapabacteria bacterium]|nr:cytochrome c biogenesis protein CcsA [Candidatus Kapabacteria bacterium]